MIAKEVIGLGVAIVILAGVAYVVFRGDSTAKIITAGGDALANAIVAATPRENVTPIYNRAA